MTYNSKRTLVSMVMGIILVIAYIFYALGAKAPAQDNLSAWAMLMLTFIGIGVVGVIVIQILFNVLFAVGIAVKNQPCEDKEVERIVSATMVEDERDKLISLKSTHVGSICAGLGILTCLIVLALGHSALTGLHVVLAATVIGSLSEGIASIFLYERGV